MIDFNIAVTGVPGTGKTTFCRLLSERGFNVLDMNVFAEINGCRDGDIVDIDCLKPFMSTVHGALLDSHYSHMLDPYAVIILSCKPDNLEKRLTDRGYDPMKIAENMDCLLSDCIYYECVENFPNNRILRLNSDGNEKDENLNKAMKFIEIMERKHNGA